MAKLLEVEIVAVQNGKEIPYETLTPEEKGELGMKMNQRAVKSVANNRGYDIKFYDSPPTTVTA